MRFGEGSCGFVKFDEDASGVARVAELAIVESLIAVAECGRGRVKWEKAKVIMDFAFESHRHVAANDRGDQ